MYMDNVTSNGVNVTVSGATTTILTYVIPAGKIFICSYFEGSIYSFVTPFNLLISKNGATVAEINSQAVASSTALASTGAAFTAGQTLLARMTQFSGANRWCAVQIRGLLIDIT